MAVEYQYQYFRRIMEIIAKGQTENQIIVTMAIDKEPLKAPLGRENIDVSDLVDDEIKQLIKDGL